MKLKSYICPSCGADLNVSLGDTDVKCEYCGQSFVIEQNVQETPDELLDELIQIHQQKDSDSNKSSKTAVVIFVCFIVGFITITTFLISFIAVIAG